MLLVLLIAQAHSEREYKNGLLNRFNFVLWRGSHGRGYGQF
jgi:hypothetical protein